ncbi:T-cell surface antigen CD2 [Mugil cephalus]|uniref:T-cell surface antigen CD2 n=1 Tax=Mugil cephalus TaxID=48193 RepID=UPI001FB64BCD|nr:T-cell surface antigen CD2 [Mugil cephalus]
MEAVVGLMLMILGVSHGGETYCDGRQNGTQCYGALGGTVVIRLMDNALEIFRYDVKRGSSVIFRWRNKTVVTNEIKDRSVFSPSDGTFRINDLSRNDSGQYDLIIFNSNGTKLSEQTLQLFIEADNLPLIAGVLSALVIVLVVVLSVIWALKKKQRNNKPKEERNDQELTYADVSIVQQQRKQTEQRTNPEVEYDQVKFSARPQQTET